MPVETKRENGWTVMTMTPEKGEVKNKLPFPCYVSAECEGMEVMNPYSKKSCTLTAEAYAVYEVIVGMNRICMEVGLHDPAFHLWDFVRSGIEWFQKFYPKEYYVLLD